MIEITIGGKILDVRQGQDITMEWRSALAGSFTEILGNSSYTIKAPRNRHNRTLFRDAYSPAREYQGRAMSADVFVDGIRIVDNASAVLTGVTETEYQIVLTWNTSRHYAVWASANHKLRDGMASEAIKWKGTATLYTNRDALMIRAMYDAGNFTTWAHSSGIAMHQPAANLLGVIDAIERERGLDITYPEGMREKLSELAILLTTRNSSPYVDAMGVTGTKVRYKRMSEEQYGDGYGMSIPSNVGELTRYKVATIPDPDAGGAPMTVYWTRWSYEANTAVAVKLQTAFSDQDFEVDTDPERDVYIEAFGFNLDSGTVATGDTFLTRIYPERISYNVDGKHWEAVFDSETKVAADEYAYVTFVLNKAIKTEIEGKEGNIGDNMVTKSNNDASVDGYFPLATNLPDISEVDFFKYVAAYMGCFLHFSGSDMIFIPYNDLFGGRRKGTELTGKIIAGTATDTGEYSYTFGKFAQRNFFRYKEDSGNYDFRADGVLYVDNDMLDGVDEKFLVLPFAASRQDEARQWLVTYDSTKGEWNAKFEKATHRLMKIVQSGLFCGLRFTADMRWDNILATRYAEYQRVMRKPKVVKVDARLTEVDLRGLDLTRSHYIGELGHDYVIISAQWSSGDKVTKLELLEI